MSDEADQPTVSRPGAADWGRISVRVLRDPTISPQAKAVYALLTTYADNAGRDSCFPRQETLADQLGISVSTIHRQVRTLEDAGVLQVRPRYRPDGGRSSNDYLLLDSIGDSTGKPVTSDVGVPGTDARGVPSTGAASPPFTSAGSLTRPGSNKTTSNTPKPPEGADAPMLSLVADDGQVVEVDPLVEEFVGFWKAYPKRVEKKAAERAYRKARRTVPLAVIREGLLRVLPVWAAKDPQFIPNPATWLNGERWADEVPVAAEPVEENRWMRRTPGDTL